MQLDIDTILQGDALDLLREMDAGSVDLICTSPPYFALRDYSAEGQVGLESTPEEYIKRLTTIFREANRVLKPDGTCWIVIGDSYAGSGGPGSWADNKQTEAFKGDFRKYANPNRKVNGLKPKDRIGIPWMLAFAMRADGWYWRDEIIWNKPNSMPESCKDRPVDAHEIILMFSKSPTYYYDWRAIVEPAAYDGRKDTKFRGSTEYKDSGHTMQERGHERWPNRMPTKTKYADMEDAEEMAGGGTNWVGHGGYHGADGRELFVRDKDGAPARLRRDVWTVNTMSSSKVKHYAMFPPKLIEPIIKAGCRPGGLVCDPFLGSGTTAIVARQLGRHFIGFDLNSDYVDMARKRVAAARVPLFV